MVGRATRQHGCVFAMQPADDAAIQPQGQHVAHPVGRAARPHVAEARQQHRPHQVVVAHHRRVVRQPGGDAAEVGGG